MAQTGFTPLLIYSSSTGGNAPAAGNLLNNATGSELAINIADGKLFYKDSANAVQVIGWKIRPATAGGTGLTSFAVGDLIYADTTTTLNKLADVATGNALISGGVGAAPSYGKIGLTTHVSGTLPTANGGTNLTSFTANGIMYASSSSILATGSALTFDGTNLATTGYVSATSFRPTSSTIPTNGIYLPTTNTLGFATNSALAMQISSTGGVSIGNTTDPGAGSLSVNNNIKVPGYRNGYSFANNVSAGTTGTYTVSVTGYQGYSSGSAVDLQSFFYVTVLSSANGHVVQGIALYTNQYNGNAIYLATLGTSGLGGSISFSASGYSPTFTVTNSSGSTPTYTVQVVHIN